MQDLIRQLLKAIGEDTEREGLLRTPERVTKSLQFLTSGYDSDPFEVVGDAIFKEAYNEMVVVRNIDIFSLCEHHMLPFYGECHIAYIPDGRIVGLSKIPRLVNLYSRRLQVQERLTSQIADSLMDILQPKGVGVVAEALHLCMAMRGVEKQHSYTTTSSMRGIFLTDQSTRSEFLNLIGKAIHH